MFKKITAFFLSVTMFFSGILPGIFGGKNVNEDVSSLIKPDTWAMTDGLGRTLSLKGDVKEKDNSKFVGLFYWTWHTNFGSWLEPQNATEILTEHPEILYDFDSPYWMPDERYPDGRPFFWEEPLWGYYLDTDEYILRKNAQLIADAGVDVIFFDCTNGTSTWDESCLKLFEVFGRAKADGVNVPKVAYMLPFGTSEETTISLKHLYDEIYSKELYKDLWFMWDGKPMIMAHSSSLNRADSEEKEIYDFFTFRKNEPSYFVKDKPYISKTWGWCSSYPQSKYDKSLNGRVE